jgi:hypothetical protein
MEDPRGILPRDGRGNGFFVNMVPEEEDKTKQEKSVLEL